MQSQETEALRGQSEDPFLKRRRCELIGAQGNALGT